MKLANVLLIAAAMPLLGGCVARVHGRATVPAPVVEYEAPTVDVYTPLYYQGYVVYYDDGGAPYYIHGGARIYISAGYREYPTYVRHYHRHRTVYRDWERRHYPRAVYRDRMPRDRYEPDRRRTQRPRVRRHHR